MPETGTKEWRVIDVREGKTEPNPHGGEFQKFYVDFEGSPDTYWRRRKGDAPEVGQSYYGTISKGSYGPMFKKEKVPADFLEGSSAPRSSNREWKPESQYDPEKTARIGRSHAQHMAILALTAMGAFDTQDAMGLRQKLEDWTSFFETDVNKAASQAGGATPAKEGAAPPASASPSPGSQKDEHQWFMHLLEAAQMDSEPAHTLAGFITEKFSKEQKARAEEGLEDSRLQLETVKKLTASYEKAEGAPLPSGDPGDDIPF